MKILKALVCPAVLYGCEEWTPRKSEEKRLDTANMCFLFYFGKVPIETNILTLEWF